MLIEEAAVLVAVLTVASGKSVRQLMVRTNFVGEGSNDLAVHLLQSESKSGENAVFSPLGYNAILAILAEGARGETRNQLAKALNLPEDTYAVRSTYKTVLSSMMEHGVLNQPEFKSWFYVYKNNSVEESYKNVMRDNYLIDIKEVDRYTYPEDDEQGHKDSPVLAMTSEHRPLEDSKEESSEEKKGDKSEESKEDEDSSEEKVTDNIAQESEVDGNDGEKAQEEGISVTELSEVAVVSGNKTAEGDQEAADEKPDLNEINDETAAKDALLEQTTKMVEIVAETTKMVEIVAETTTEAISENQVDPKAEDAQENSKGDRMNLEDIIARSLKSEIRSEKEMVSALSANRLASLNDGGLKPNSRMIIFNALYFRGNWSTPLKSTKEKVPFATAGGEKMVDAMTGEGELDTGRIPDLGATALDLPYQGDKYSMLILLPDERDGLGELVRKLSGFSFKNIGQYLTKRQVNVIVPMFRFYTISKPKDALLKSGVKDIFGEEADLSGITGTKSLYLDDLVQLVTLDVDESHSSNIQLTIGAIPETRSAGVTFKADRPFMFVVRDRQENLVVVAGLVQNPSVNRD